jgi:hypothetical protein
MATGTVKAAIRGESAENPARSVQSLGFSVYKPSGTGYYLKALFYGDPGVGKTTLAASAEAVPEMKDALLINIEGGALAVSDPSVYGADSVIDAVDFSGFDFLQTVFAGLAKGDHGYKTVIIDSLSELVKYNLDSIIQKKIDNGARNRDTDDIFLEDYGTMTKQMRRVVRMFRDLPMHVIYTCHAAPVDQSENSKIGPDLSNKLRASVIGYMDVVGYMYIGEKTVTETGTDGKPAETKVPCRKLLCTPLGKFIAKDRSPGNKLGKTIDEPTMQIIMDKISGKA